TFTVRVTINHENSLTTVTGKATVAAVSKLGDTLVIGAFAGPIGGGATIRVDPVGTQSGTSTDVVQVTINGVSQGTFTGFSKISVLGQGGNDDIRVDGRIKKNAALSGGPGNDTLVGGAGN